MRTYVALGFIPGLLVLANVLTHKMSQSIPAVSPPGGSTDLTETLPEPYPVSEIAPVLQAFRRGGKTVTLKYGTSPEEGRTLLTDNDLLATRQVVFLVHGFRNELETEWMHVMKDAILKQADDTVILVGWGSGANLALIHYWQAAANTQVVGKWLAEHVTALKQGDPDLDMWGIGHSLGAHVLGTAGRDSGAFKRITGLDPAGPSFEKVNQDKRLDPSAATFVDVIHTDGFEHYYDPIDWFAPTNHYGTLIPLGTIDFYPNFGTSNQPGCELPVVDGFACSHLRAIDLFTWSISNPGQFKTDEGLAKAPEFESPVTDLEKGPLAQMGYYADHFPIKGNYYLPTNAEEPWSTCPQSALSWCNIS